VQATDVACTVVQHNPICSHFLLKLKNLYFTAGYTIRYVQCCCSLKNWLFIYVDVVLLNVSLTHNLKWLFPKIFGNLLIKSNILVTLSMNNLLSLYLKYPSCNSNFAPHYVWLPTACWLCCIFSIYLTNGAISWEDIWGDIWFLTLSKSLLFQEEFSTILSTDLLESLC